MSARRDRRSFLKAGAAAVAAASLPRAPGLAAEVRPRVGIIGGGLAGIACAWLLDGVADAVLFESSTEIGGHAHTIPVLVDGATIQVDVGAQFFARGPHPTYTKLLEVLGLLDPAHPDHDQTVEADMTITVAGATGGVPRFVSPSPGRAWPILARWNRSALAAFFVFTRAARRLSREGDWLLPVGTWLEGLPLRKEVRDEVLLPLLAAMTGCSIEEVLTQSARAAVLFIAKALPDNLLDPVRYGNSLLGLQGNVARLARDSRNLSTHLGATVTGVRPRAARGFRIDHAAGASEDVDVVVFATPPYAAGPLLSEIPEMAEAAAVLAQFEYFASDISIHRDPAYMPERRRHWSAYNVRADGAQAEGSVWYGALRPVAAGDRPLMLFKSWATARSESPRDELFRRTFRHPLITPGFIELQDRLATHQGRAGVWFAGSYTAKVDSQETALLSAMNVVRALHPQAPNLLALES